MQRSSELTYTPAWWVPGRHAQTLWGRLFRRPPDVETRLERWATPDDDELEVHRLDAADPNARLVPRLVLLHGLEGTIHSNYIRGTLALARDRGWAADVLIFRGCGTRMNRQRRIYHSGETADLDMVVHRLVEENPGQPMVLAGFSLGGNVLLKWLGERGDCLPRAIRGAATVSVPFDLEAGTRQIEYGFSRIYTHHFLRSLVVKARAKLLAYPDLFDRDRLEQVKTLYDFDDVVTAPVHGFTDAHDYYSQSSALHFLPLVRSPTLLLSATDDPFMSSSTADAVLKVARANSFLHAEFHSRGGHVGFVAGRIPFLSHYYAEERVIEFLSKQLIR
ncbi:MAG: hydrolase [Gemmatimonadota bacterium]|nr:hydrolase [Gemmatimonadota bacterium]